MHVAVRVRHVERHARHLALVVPHAFVQLQELGVPNLDSAQSLTGGHVSAVCAIARACVCARASMCGRLSMNKRGETGCRRLECTVGEALISAQLDKNSGC